MTTAAVRTFTASSDVRNGEGSPLEAIVRPTPWPPLIFGGFVGVLYAMLFNEGGAPSSLGTGFALTFWVGFIGSGVGALWGFASIFRTQLAAGEDGISWRSIVRTRRVDRDSLDGISWSCRRSGWSWPTRTSIELEMRTSSGTTTETLCRLWFVDNGSFVANIDTNAELSAPFLAVCREYGVKAQYKAT